MPSAMNQLPDAGTHPASKSHSDEILVRVDGVSKKFCRDLKKSLWYGLKDFASELLPIQNSTSNIQNHEKALRSGEFWANKDISFQLKRGECIGLIGRNGAGKTTLLKMLNGLIKPDAGTIEIRGRVGALIALGAGFNPILTGRENIYVNGSILGLTKEEIDAKVEDIINFAEVHEFIDSPVQSYSSGMQVRLGFAVATALNPDVLILDEVLAVGDAAFRAKCYRRIMEIRKSAAVIFVTHSMEQISRICDYTLVLSKGEIRFHGDVPGGVRSYDEINELGVQDDPSFLFLNKPFEEFLIELPPESIDTGGPTELIMNAKMAETRGDYKIRITIYALNGSVVAEVNDSAERHGYHLSLGENKFRLNLPNVPLRPGKYQLGINMIDDKGDILVWSYKQYSLNITGYYMGGNTECQIPISSWRKA
jgi:lipopolysaccharide transport system ATP-binding protein